MSWIKPASAFVYAKTILCIIALSASWSTTRGEDAANEPSAIELAAAVADVSAPPSDQPVKVRFRQQSANPGDRVVQRLGVHLALKTKIIQSGQVAHEGANEMRRQQQRTIQVLEVAEGRATKARATFQLSRRQSPENDNPDELAVQTIEGKTYLADRREDKLTITDEAGAVPPLEEYKLAAESLENIGKPNPLAQVLVDRRIAVGELIRVPRDLVQPLLGLDDPMGTVHRFELTLARVENSKETGTSSLAIFKTTVEVRPDDDSPLSINLQGELAVEIETCRLASVDLTGPVQMSTIERTGGGIYQFSAGGELKLAIRSQYGRAK